MFYILYLSSLCRRRRWSDPHYECKQYTTGYVCNVRVNNRDYQGDSVHATEVLAQENAAMRAYLICRNISVHENIYSQTAGLISGGGAPAVPVASAGVQSQRGGYPQGMATGQGMPSSMVMAQLPQGGLLVNGMGSQGM